jgi:two-component system, chemotaxis family, chemotaxis protein CheY
MTKSVLVVDDNDDVLSSIAEFLKEEGFEVHTAYNGREALDFLRAHSAPDIVLLDLMMPIMNGWEFREEQLRDAQLSRIPVVVMTASGNARAEAQQLKAVGHFAKPFRYEELVSALRSLA